MNLASWTYRNAMVSEGGPIARIAIRDQEIHPGRSGFEAMASLKPELRVTYDKHQIYGTADGTGASRYRHVACHTAISEALERWAFYATVQSSDRSRFAFDLDSTTTGMAAFSGLLRSAPRRRALLEAVERWSICAWWEGRLSAQMINTPWPEISAIEINSPWSLISVVILWTSANTTRPHAYGFASAQNATDAVEKASIELMRNESVLCQHENSQLLTEPDLLQERRLLYFASEKGRHHFKTVVQRSLASKSLAIATPKLLVDSEIIGPWSKYATVWRCLFDPISDAQYEKTSQYFLF